MIPMMLAVATAAVVRSLMAERLERWNVGAPAVMVVAGALAGFTVAGSVAEALNTEVALHSAEVILAVLLFVDATEVRRGRLWGYSPGLAARLLLVAMPLSVVAAVVVGVPLFPDLALPALFVLACVVMPIDFAPSERVVRDRRLSTRMRSVLNVEGGYNDGIISPVFVFALALAAGAARSAADPLAALGTAVSQAVLAIVAGLVLGSLLGWLLDRAAELAWTTDQSRRVVVLLAPLVTYAVAVAIGGNGFVASFVCGIAFRYVHRSLVARRLRRPDHVLVGAGRASAAMGQDFALLEDVTALMTMAMWFVVGLAGVPLIALVDLPIVAFCALALTVLRIAAVWVAMLGSGMSGREQLLLGLLGPRGTTTIVFGLLAFNALPDGLPADTILLTTILCVVGSVVLHGLGSSPAIARLAPTPTPPRPSAHTT